MAGRVERRLANLGPARVTLGSLCWRRSRLTNAFGSIAIGAAALSGLLALQAGLRERIAREVRGYGANLAIVPVGSERIREPDLADLARIVPPGRLVAAAPFLEGVGWASSADRRTRVAISGTRVTKALATMPYATIYGTPPIGRDQALAGASVSARLGIDPGATVLLRAEGGTELGQRLQITGILESGGPEDEMLLVDLGVAQELLGRSGEVSRLAMSIVAQEEELEAIQRAIERRRPALKARSVRRVQRAESRIQERINTLYAMLLAVIVACCTLSASVALAAAVGARAAEVALKRALGAPEARIALEICGEAGALGLCGGTVGYLLGLMLSAVLARAVFGMSNPWAPVVLPVTVAGALAVALASVLLAASGALRRDPAVLLRS